MIWFNTSLEGYRLMNLEFPGTDGKPLIKMVDNDWEIFTNPTDLNCIPSGKQITITFPKGEFLDIRFKDIKDVNEFRKQIPKMGDKQLNYFQFPLCLFSLKLVLPNLRIIFDSDSHATVGNLSLQGGVMFFYRNLVGLRIE